MVLLPDPRAVHLQALLDGVRERWRRRRSSAPAPRSARRDARRSSGAGARSRRARSPGSCCAARGAPRVGVTQACRPASELLTVTRAQGHWILELDGRPALDVYREVARGPLAEDLRRAAAFVLAALPRDPAAPLAPGGYLVRNVAGFAVAERALAIPEPLAVGDRIAFVQRDPAAAREDLKAMLGAAARAGARRSASTSTAARAARRSSACSGLEAALPRGALRRAPRRRHVRLLRDRTGRRPHRAAHLYGRARAARR